MKKENKLTKTESNERVRSRIKTEAALRQSLSELETSNQRISISAVAAATGVSPALIHNKYPDIAEAIRKRIGKSVRSQRDENRTQLAKAHENIRTLRHENKSLEEDLRKLTSINECLRRQLNEAIAIAKSKNVIVIPKK